MIKKILLTAIAVLLFIPSAAHAVSTDVMTKGDFVIELLDSTGFSRNNYTPLESSYFSDVLQEDPLFVPIAFLVDSGAVKKPKSETAFYKNRGISLINALQLTYFMKGIPVPRIFDVQSWTFENISPRAPFAHLLQKAATLGMINSERVAPFRILKRGEALNIIARANANSSPNITITLSPSTTHEAVTNPIFPIFLDAWNKINQDYIRRDQVEKQDLIYGATKGLVESLDDRYSEFMPPSDNSLGTELSGEIEGIGASVEMVDKKVTVVAPLRDSPAEKAGILTSDILLSANGVSFEGLTLQKAVSLIKGPAGTNVTLIIERSGQRISITVTRARIKLNSVELEFTNDNIAVIKLNNFSADSHMEFSKAVREILQKNPTGVILDMRNNPGGFLDVAVSIAGFFIDSGSTVVKIRFPDHTEIKVSNGEAELSRFPIVVLINKGSASASEILAGAILDHNKGVLIGETTFGKGTVQEFITYTDGSSLKITVAEWLTPLDHLIDKNGIEPTIKVTLSDTDKKAKLDPQMDRALEEIR
ncbi:MAG: S41 family peptidase [Patescibacteria group bacterium]